jgi:outer membrane protein assembly factor BamB
MAQILPSFPTCMTKQGIICMKTRLPLPLLLMGALAPSLCAENWPSWRGPRGDGTSRETIAPLRWSSQDNVAWKTAVPGKGHSSPVVWGDRVFVTTCLEQDGRRLLLCYNRRDGKLLWEQVVLTAELEKLHALNSRASSTPATDGRHVYVSFLANPRMQVACYDMDGHLVWRKSPGEFHSRHGFCSPPILYKDMVILNGDQDAVAWLVALDKSTGAERWRTDRPNRTRSYCPPLIVEAGGKTQLVLSGSKCVAGYDPDTGKQLWLIDGPTEQYVASLVFANGLFFMTAGFPTYHLMAIKPDGAVAWHHDRLPERQASYVPSPIAHGEYFFVVSDPGFLTCLDARTGKKLWFERLGQHHSASPISVGDNLYFVSDDGVTYVVKAGPRFELVSKNPLGDECYASPAVSRGQIFIRTLHNLYCIGSETKAAQD